METSSRVSTEQGVIVLQYLARALFAILAVLYFNHSEGFFFTVPTATPWILAGSFVAIALWLLVPDKDDSADSKFLGMGAFMATTIMFFLAEIGDKTQVATVVLAARFTETFWVILGTTVGMLLANIPVIMAGRWLMERLPLATARIGASVLFVVLAVVTVWATFMNS